MNTTSRKSLRALLLACVVTLSLAPNLADARRASSARVAPHAAIHQEQVHVPMIDRHRGPALNANAARGGGGGRGGGGRGGGGGGHDTARQGRSGVAAAPHHKSFAAQLSDLKTSHATLPPSPPPSPPSAVIADDIIVDNGRVKVAASTRIMPSHDAAAAGSGAWPAASAAVARAPKSGLTHQNLSCGAIFGPFYGTACCTFNGQCLQQSVDCLVSNGCQQNCVADADIPIGNNVYNDGTRQAVRDELAAYALQLKNFRFESALQFVHSRAQRTAAAKQSSPRRVNLHTLSQFGVNRFLLADSEALNENERAVMQAVNKSIVPLAFVPPLIDAHLLLSLREVNDADDEARVLARRSSLRAAASDDEVEQQSVIAKAVDEEKARSVHAAASEERKRGSITEEEKENEVDERRTAFNRNARKRTAETTQFVINADTCDPRVPDDSTIAHYLRDDSESRPLTYTCLGDDGVTETEPLHALSQCDLVQLMHSYALGSNQYANEIGSEGKMMHKEAEDFNCVHCSVENVKQLNRVIAYFQLGCPGRLASFLAAIASSTNYLTEFDVNPIDERLNHRGAQNATKTADRLIYYGGSALGLTRWTLRSICASSVELQTVFGFAFGNTCYDSLAQPAAEKSPPTSTTTASATHRAAATTTTTIPATSSTRLPKNAFAHLRLDNARAHNPTHEAATSAQVAAHSDAHSVSSPLRNGAPHSATTGATEEAKPLLNFDDLVALNDRAQKRAFHHNLNNLVNELGQNEPKKVFNVGQPDHQHYAEAARTHNNHVAAGVKQNVGGQRRASNGAAQRPPPVQGSHQNHFAGANGLPRQQAHAAPPPLDRELQFNKHNQNHIMTGGKTVAEKGADLRLQQEKAHALQKAAAQRKTAAIAAAAATATSHQSSPTKSHNTHDAKQPNDLQSAPYRVIPNEAYPANSVAPHRALAPPLPRATAATSARRASSTTMNPYDAAAQMHSTRPRLTQNEYDARPALYTAPHGIVQPPLYVETQTFDYDIQQQKLQQQQQQQQQLQQQQQQQQQQLNPLQEMRVLESEREAARQQQQLQREQQREQREQDEGEARVEREAQRQFQNQQKIEDQGRKLEHYTWDKPGEQHYSWEKKPDRDGGEFHFGEHEKSRLGFSKHGRGGEANSRLDTQLSKYFGEHTRHTSTVSHGTPHGGLNQSPRVHESSLAHAHNHQPQSNWATAILEGKSDKDKLVTIQQMYRKPAAAAAAAEPAHLPSSSPPKAVANIDASSLTASDYDGLFDFDVLKMIYEKDERHSGSQAGFEQSELLKRTLILENQLILLHSLTLRQLQDANRRMPSVCACPNDNQLDAIMLRPHLFWFSAAQFLTITAGEYSADCDLLFHRNRHFTLQDHERVLNCILNDKMGLSVSNKDRGNHHSDATASYARKRHSVNGDREVFIYQNMLRTVQSIHQKHASMHALQFNAAYIRQIEAYAFVAILVSTLLAAAVMKRRAVYALASPFLSKERIRVALRQPQVHLFALFDFVVTILRFLKTKISRNTHAALELFASPFRRKPRAATLYSAARGDLPPRPRAAITSNAERNRVDGGGGDKLSHTERRGDVFLDISDDDNDDVSEISHFDDYVPISVYSGRLTQQQARYQQQMRALTPSNDAAGSDTSASYIHLSDSDESDSAAHTPVERSMRTAFDRVATPAAAKRRGANAAATDATDVSSESAKLI